MANPNSGEQVLERGEVPDGASTSFSALRSIDHPVFALDEDGKLAALSDPLLQVLGIPEPDLVGQPATDVFAGAIDVQASGTRGWIRFCASHGKSWQACLTYPSVPSSTTSRVVIGVLTRLTPLLPSESEACQAVGGGPAADAATFSAHLREYLRTKRAPYSVTAGRIELIGLDEAIATLGDQWPANLGRAKACASAIIAKHLAETDTFGETENDEFIICFGDLSADEARLKSDLIAREIRDRLIDESVAGIEIASQAEALSISSDEVCFGSDQVQPDIDLIAVLSSHLSAAKTQQQEMRAKRVSSLLENTHLAFSPVLNRSLTPNGLLVAGIGGDCGQWLQGVSSHADGLKRIFDLDCHLLGMTVKHQYNIMAKDKPPYIILPINFSAVSHRNCLQDFCALCDQIENSVRQRIIFMLTGVTTDSPPSGIDEILSCLGQFSVRQGLRVPNAQYDISNIKTSRLSFISLRASGGFTTTKKAKHSFKKFAASVHTGPTFPLIMPSQISRVFVSDIADAKAARWYAANGADILSMAKNDRRPASETPSES